MAFNHAKHVKYWQRCTGLLPNHYESADGSRTFLAFFIVSALDLLGVLHPSDQNSRQPAVTEAQRQSWIEWVYSLQVPEGGFRGFTGTDLGEARDQTNACWDSGNLPNTFFALALLLVLHDDLSRVDRDRLLRWLPKLQRRDGSFGEILGPEDRIEGNRDLRYCCCAAGIAYMLRADRVFNTDALIGYILNCQSYEGGFGESPLREAHSGLNYCAVSTLELLSRGHESVTKKAQAALNECKERNLRWMLERKTDVLEDEEQDDDDGEASRDEQDSKNGTQDHDLASDHVEVSSLIPKIVGFNGRSNKIADTCYSFWNAGVFAIFDALHLVDTNSISRYLLEKTQHIIGGFGKAPGAPPDVLHAYLGLAALSLFDRSGQYGLKQIDPGLCISTDAVERLPKTGEEV